ncbi:class I SAM-dependent methyltransferase [Psychroserpens jangbogonensis]|uniref:class I SAM-dependent methyltransferase n=1 Tax=Psychroserpens jangbogonensis TaxID=1484460 RepID=UPI00053D0592|nr:class I SAM-dependent methyltransferase [Psychroserpens jangbogonensis]
MEMVYLLKGYVKGKLRSVYKLLLSNSSIARKYLRKSDTAGSNSLYCYGIWMKHLKYWSLLNNKTPEVVVEIGPGNSLGVGLAALISGSETLYALERTQFWNTETNIRVFDELVALFKTEKKTKKINIESVRTVDEELGFPSDILTKVYLSQCLNTERLKKIRKELSDPSNPNNAHIHSVIPWESIDAIEDNKVDYIFSHTVLQHIDDLPNTYKAMNKWLKNGGCISHKIDFKSMNTTKLWNQHWTLNDAEWQIVTGGTNLINREPLSSHLKFLEINGFEIIQEIKDSSDNELSAEDLSDKFKQLNISDLTTSGYYYYAQLKKK